MKKTRNNIRKNSWKKLKIILLILLGIILLLIIFNWSRLKKEEKNLLNKKDVFEKSIIERGEILSQSIVKSKNEIKEIKEEVNSSAIRREREEDEIKIPEQIQRDVSFVSQSPFASWDEIHEEACEEASLIMIKYYLDGKKLTKQKMEDEIQDLVDYQNEKYGDHKDSDMKELKKIAEDYYKIKNIKIVKDFAREDIKKYLTKGLIIVPTAGRELGNPNFTPPGPLYHNLVLVGYNGDSIIVNDPGTRKGKDYAYDVDILYNAIHDFSGDKKKILNGKKVMLVFPLN